MKVLFYGTLDVFTNFQERWEKMRKVLLMTAISLALSGAVIADETAPKVDAAPLAPAAEAPKMMDAHKGHHGFKHMTKDEVVAKLVADKDKVAAEGAKLEGLDKDLFDAAIARAAKWIETIKGYTEAGTDYSRSANRAKKELCLAKDVLHHKEPYPTEKVAKWKGEFEGLKAEVAKLTGDMKAAADTIIANIEGVFADLEKAKDTTHLSHYVRAVKCEVGALKGFLHHATMHKAEPMKAEAAHMEAHKEAEKPAEAPKA